MSEPKTGFEKLIELLPRQWKVLDVGGGGLHGENTTDALVEHFDDVTCVCWADTETDVYKARLDERKIKRPRFISADYYTIDFANDYGLVVTDLNVENNLARDWSDEGIERVRDMLIPGGVWITYVITTDQYDSEETGAFIREQSKKLWGRFPFDNEDIGKRLSSLKGWEIYGQEQESRRSYIHWVALRKV